MRDVHVFLRLPRKFFCVTFIAFPLYQIPDLARGMDDMMANCNNLVSLLFFVAVTPSCDFRACCKMIVSLTSDKEWIVHDVPDILSWLLALAVDVVIRVWSAPDTLRCEKRMIWTRWFAMLCERRVEGGGRAFQASEIAQVVTRATDARPRQLCVHKASPRS